MFGKTNIRFCDMDKLMGLIRFSPINDLDVNRLLELNSFDSGTSINSILVDNYVVNNYDYVSDSGKCYHISIETDDNILNSEKFHSNTNKI